MVDLKATGIELTAILIPDKKTGEYSAFFAQFPGAIAQGGDEKEAMNNLVILLQHVMEDQKNESLETVDGHYDFKTQSFKLIHA